MFQLAVIEAAYPEAMKEIGIAGLLMPALAAVGKMLGYKADPFVTDDYTSIRLPHLCILTRRLWVRFPRDPPAKT